jgi:hypothetical protein
MPDRYDQEPRPHVPLPTELTPAKRKIPCPAEIIFNGVDSNDMTQVEVRQNL